jgi:hypothetical protein
MTGMLSILGCHAGDIRITFDKDDPREVEKAKRIISDMLKRGYLLFVEDEDGKAYKVVSFDADTNEYVLKDNPIPEGCVLRTARKPKPCQVCREIIHANEQYYDRGGRVWHIRCKAPPKPLARSRKSNRRSLTKSKATGVAPTAGG